MSYTLLQLGLKNAGKVKELFFVCYRGLEKAARGLEVGIKVITAVYTRCGGGSGVLFVVCFFCYNFSQKITGGQRTFFWFFSEPFCRGWWLRRGVGRLAVGIEGTPVVCTRFARASALLLVVSFFLSQLQRQNKGKVKGLLFIFF